MFEVMAKNGTERRSVYSIRQNPISRETEFLIYAEHSGWIWTPADRYKPFVGIQGGETN